MMKKCMKKLAAVITVAVLLCMNTILIASAAQSVLDAGGLLEITTSDGKSGQIDGALVLVNDRRMIFSIPGLTDKDACEYHPAGQSESVTMKCIAGYQYFTILECVEETSNLAALQLGEWSGSGTIGLIYYNTGSHKLDQLEVAVTKESNGILLLQNATQDITAGAAVIDVSNGCYIGMLAKSEDGNLYCLTTDYLSQEINGSENGSNTGSGAGYGSDGDAGSDGGAGSGNGSGSDGGTGSGDGTGSGSGSGSGDGFGPDGGTGSGGEKNDASNFYPVIGILAVVGVAGVLFFLYSKNKKNNESNKVVPLPLPGDDTEIRICICGEGGAFNGKKIELTGSAIIGRQADRCNICYPEDEKGISGMHCQLRKIGNQIELIDLGSSYGTFVNGQMIAPNTAVRLNVGEKFWLADEINTFEVCR